ncbi:MAG: DEAD/DEAH box helicase family protein [Nanoarchaeota archaeon]
MEDVEIYKINESYLKISVPIYLQRGLKKYFSVLIKNHWFHPKVKSGQWDGKISFFNIRNGLLPVGFLDDLINYCKKNDLSYNFNFNIQEIKEKISNNKFKKMFDIIFKDTDFYPRDYQDLAIRKAITNKNGIIKAATGSGKSLIIYIIVRYLLAKSKNALILVPTTSLVEQLFSDFKEYGWTDAHKHVCTVYAGQKVDYSKEIIISTWQSACKKSDDWYKNFKGLIVDECLHPKTKIAMWNGSKMNIEDVSLNDYVLSYNEKTNEIEPKRVEKVYKNLSKDSKKYCLEDENGNIFFKNGITANHKVFTQRGWKRIDELKEGDELYEI